MGWVSDEGGSYYFDDDFDNRHRTPAVNTTDQYISESGGSGDTYWEHPVANPNYVQDTTSLEGMLSSYNQSNFDSAGVANQMRAMASKYGVSEAALIASIPATFSNVFHTAGRTKDVNGFTEGSNYAAIVQYAVQGAIQAAGQNPSVVAQQNPGYVDQGAAQAQARWQGTQEDDDDFGGFLTIAAIVAAVYTGGASLAALGGEAAAVGLAEEMIALGISEIPAAAATTFAGGAGELTLAEAIAGAGGEVAGLTGATTAEAAAGLAEAVAGVGGAATTGGGLAEGLKSVADTLKSFTDLFPPELRAAVNSLPPGAKQAIVGAITNPQDPLGGALRGGVLGIAGNEFSSILQNAGLDTATAKAITAGASQFVQTGTIDPTRLALSALTPELSKGLTDVGVPPEALNTAVNAVKQLVTNGTINAEQLALGAGNEAVSKAMAEAGIPSNYAKVIGGAVASAVAGKDFNFASLASAVISGSNSKNAQDKADEAIAQDAQEEIDRQNTALSVQAQTAKDTGAANMGTETEEPAGDDIDPGLEPGEDGLTDAERAQEEDIIAALEDSEGDDTAEIAQFKALTPAQRKAALQKLAKDGKTGLLGTIAQKIGLTPGQTAALLGGVGIAALAAYGSKDKVTSEIVKSLSPEAKKEVDAALTALSKNTYTKNLGMTDAQKTALTALQTQAGVKNINELTAKIDPNQTEAERLAEANKNIWKTSTDNAQTNLGDAAKLVNKTTDKYAGTLGSTLSDSQKAAETAANKNVNNWQPSLTDAAAQIKDSTGAYTGNLKTNLSTNEQAATDLAKTAVGASKLKFDAAGKLITDSAGVYAGDVGAKYTKNQEDAGALARSTQGNWKPGVDAATKNYVEGGTGITAERLKPYENAFSVTATDPTVKRIQEERGIDRLNLQSEAARRGGFGGSRALLTEGLAADKFSLRAQQLQYDAARDAFDRATQLYGIDQARKLQAGGLLEGAAKTTSDLSGNDTTRLLTTGQDQERNARANADRQSAIFEAEKARQLASGTGLTNLGTAASNVTQNEIAALGRTGGVETKLNQDNTALAYKADEDKKARDLAAGKANITLGDTTADLGKQDVTTLSAVGKTAQDTEMYTNEQKYQADKDEQARKLAAAKELGTLGNSQSALGGDLSRYNAQSITNLSDTGGITRAIEQQRLDDTNKEWLRQQNELKGYDTTALNLATDTANADIKQEQFAAGVPIANAGAIGNLAALTSTSKTTASPPSILAQLAGVASAGAGAAIYGATKPS